MKFSTGSDRILDTAWVVHTQVQTISEGMFHTYTHVRMRELKGQACRARVTPATARLRASLAAVPGLFGHAFGPCHMKKHMTLAETITSHAANSRTCSPSGSGMVWSLRWAAARSLLPFEQTR